MLGSVLAQIAIVTAVAAPPKLATAPPGSVGIDANQLARIDGIVAEGIQQGNLPGCVVAIGRHRKIVMLKAYGHRQVKPTRQPMQTDTVFDLASLTKPIATATSVMTLVERDLLALSDPVAKFIPEFGAHGKQRITILQLLVHQGGLTPDNSLREYDHGIDEAYRRIHELKPRVEPGTRFMYTDVGFIVLAELVQRVTGKNVHDYSQEVIFNPLGMDNTGFLPRAELRERAATTERREGRWMRGEVHDPRSYRLGGVAGHAGLFSTAEDLAVFADMMLQEGQFDGVRIMTPQTVRQMTRPVRVSSGLRGLGWDIRTGYSTNRGQRFSDRAFGHGGFTGTAIWIDPELDLFVIVLSNRLHPDGKGVVNPLIGRISTATAAAINSDQR